MIGDAATHSVQRLKDESDALPVAGERTHAEGAGGAEAVGTVRQQQSAPEGSGVLRAHVSAGAECVRGWCGVQVEGRLAAQLQRHVQAPGAAQRALALALLQPQLLSTLGPVLLSRALAAPAPPAVVSVHVAAGQVDPGLVVGAGGALQAGEGQGVQAHGTLGPRRVQLSSQHLQVFGGRRAGQTLLWTPQQSRTAQVD